MNRSIAIASLIALSACTTAQQTTIEAAIQANAAKVQSACGVTLALVNSPAAQILALAIPYLPNAILAVKAGCTTADGIASLAQSASSVDWLASINKAIETNGEEIPAPVLSIPIGDDVVVTH